MMAEAETPRTVSTTALAAADVLVMSFHPVLSGTSISPKRLLPMKDITRLLLPMFVRDLGNYVGGGH